MSNENEYNYITVESGHYTVEPTQINVMHLFLCSIISNLFFKSFFPQNINENQVEDPCQENVNGNNYLEATAHQNVFNFFTYQFLSINNRLNLD